VTVTLIGVRSARGATATVVAVDVVSPLMSVACTVAV
jgi:hypothetical protein